MLQYSVDSVLLNFPETREYLSCRKKCIVVGNPLRGGFGAIPKHQAREKLGMREDEQLVLCYAGSLGSATVNAAVLQMLRTLAPTRPNTRFVLATGTANYEDAMKQYREYELDAYDNVTVKDYIYDMPLIMAAADVVISRAGAMSLSELARMGKAAVVIPSPNVADDHQLSNARALADRGEVLLVEERDFSGGALPRAVLRLLDDRDLRHTLEKAIRTGAGALLESVELFDVYTGSQIPEGKKSVAYAMTLRSDSGTLNDKQSDKVMRKIIAEAEKLGATLRS
jgi:UDP-N-acetylglucosamine--N-acetylmuramyl-(pentapeptide) pyrophosphoryl-undecaprenol N-acetylglucosamine transferase